MSKSCCFAVALAAICLTISLSLKADANPIVDKNSPCNYSTLEDVANMVKMIALNQQASALEIRDVKRLLAAGSGEKNNTNGDHNATQTSKQALVSALVCKYLVCFQFDSTNSTHFRRTNQGGINGFIPPSCQNWTSQLLKNMFLI